MAHVNFLTSIYKRNVVNVPNNEGNEGNEVNKQEPILESSFVKLTAKALKIWDPISFNFGSSSWVLEVINNFFWGFVLLNSNELEHDNPLKTLKYHQSIKAQRCEKSKDKLYPFFR